jgi:hypothetical protein
MALTRFPLRSDVIRILLTVLAIQAQICMPNSLLAYRCIVTVVKISYTNIHDHLLITAGVSASNRFTQLDECICPGFNLTFECSILGSGLTVWQGSAFNCASSSHQILLSHSQFEDGISKRCNNGANMIMASSIGIVSASNGIGDQCYISQLHVAVTDAVRNKTIECFHDSGSQQSAIIGNASLIFTTGIWYTINYMIANSVIHLWYIKFTYKDLTLSS